MKREIAVRLVEEVILEDLGLGPSKYSVSSNLRNLDADSLDIVQMMIDLEDKVEYATHTATDIPDTKIQHLRTVGDVIDMLEKDY